LAIAVFQGVKPSGGYSIQIQKITQKSHTIIVITDFEEPQPGIAVPAVVTSPYHLVSVKKSHLWSGIFIFELWDSQSQIYAASYQFP
jgi:hypothetical protein